MPYGCGPQICIIINKVMWAREQEGLRPNLKMKYFKFHNTVSI